MHVSEQFCPLYRIKVFIVLSNSAKKIKSILLDCGEPLPLYAYAVRAISDAGTAVFLIFNFHKKGTVITPGTIAHESLHAANMILNEVGVQTDQMNDEALTYLTEWIVDEVHDFVEEEGFNIGFTNEDIGDGSGDDDVDRSTKEANGSEFKLGTVFARMRFIKPFQGGIRDGVRDQSIQGRYTCRQEEGTRA